MAAAVAELEAAVLTVLAVPTITATALATAVFTLGDTPMSIRILELVLLAVPLAMENPLERERR